MLVLLIIEKSYELLANKRTSFFNNSIIPDDSNDDINATIIRKSNESSNIIDTDM